jgi:pyridoxal phosphate enzyme (YggS family)
MTDGSNGTVSIRDNVAAVETRIARACERAGRSREEVTLVAVSKTFPASFVDEAIEAGIAEVGENRVQEAREKKPLVRGSARWHLIGHLQSNKARHAARFDVVHSIDGTSLLRKVDEAATDAGRRIDVLVQVDLAGEATKHGVREEEVLAVIEGARSMRSCRTAGLMILPPAVDNPDAARPYFRALRELRAALQKRGLDASMLQELSMGMSHDFEVAVEEGATMVRVGTAIFGGRPPAQGSTDAAAG